MGNTLRRFREFSFAMAVLLAAVLALGSLAPASAVEATGSISGTVSQELNGALSAGSGVYVIAYSADGQDWMGSAQTDADGNYSIDSLPAGSFKLSFDTYNADANLLPEWWDNATDFTSATPIKVTAGTTTSGKNATLAQGSTITGTVTKIVDGVAVPAENVNVSANANANYWNYANAQTSADGSYSIKGLRAGNYTVRFDDSFSGLVSEYYDNAATTSTATLVAVGEQTTVSAIDASLASGAAISGTVSQEINGVLSGGSGVYVTAHSADGQDWMGSARTDADGNYSIDSLPAGTFKLSFDTYNADANLVPEWWDNATDFTSATPIKVAAGTTISGKNATLAQGSTITGTVTKNINGARSPAAGIDVTAYSVSDGTPIRTSGTNSKGEYQIDSLLTGSYKVGFAQYSTSTSLVAEFFDNVSDFGSATPIVVGAGSSTPGIDAELSDQKLSVFTAAPVPTISGTTTEGKTLTAAAGSWTPEPVALTYQWSRGTSAITGATKSTYLLVPADVGQTITVTVTGTKTGYITQTKTSVPTTAIAAAPKPFTAAPVPTISGTTTVGSSLTAVSGTWGPGTATLGYQWKRAGTVIAGATARTYLLSAADFGKTLTVDVTGTQTGYIAQTKSSVATAAITAGSLTAAPTPTITGTLKGGNLLTANTGTWGPAPVTLAYQWYRSGVAITGATANTFTLTAADISQTIKVKVTGTKTGYTTAAKTSASTAAITTGTLTSTIPTVTGTAKFGSVLTASAGTWGPATVTLKYQWYRTGTAITGATGNTYTLTAADLGKTMTMTITGSKSGATSVTKTSVATTAVLAGTLTAPTPTITGTLKGGSTLTANPGTWGPATVTLKYQWYRSGVAITGATLKTYALVSADRDDMIKVRVLGSKAGYTSVAKDSTPTVKIP